MQQLQTHGSTTNVASQQNVESLKQQLQVMVETCRQGWYTGEDIILYNIFSVVVVDLPLLRVAVEGSDNPISLEEPCQASLPPDQQGHHSLGRHPVVLGWTQCLPQRVGVPPAMLRGRTASFPKKMGGRASGEAG